VVIAGGKWGGQLQLTSLVENFPGFPDGIQGPELMLRMRQQAENLGAEILETEFTAGDFSKRPFKVSTLDDQTREAKAVIIATGADTRWLNVPGEQEKIGRGISSCATCDAGFFRNKVVAVVGGGDSAMEEALVLSKVASQVTLIHRKDTFRASQIMQDRVKENPKITILYNSAITEVQGDMKVEKVKIKNLISNEEQEMAVSGVFVAIGHIPNTKIIKGIDLDKEGYVVPKGHFHTNVEGVFTAGDVHDREYRQAITAAGYGASAAIEVEKWLQTQSN
jgi:thioredoxin reductase (NADPH)